MTENAAENQDGILKKKFFFNSSRGCSICESKEPIDYKNVKSLARFVTKRGKIMPSRISGVCSKHQRQVKKAIRRARILALLPFVNKG